MKKTVATGLIVIGGLLMALIALQSKMIFFPETLDAAYDFRLGENATEVFVETDDGERINALWFRAEASRGVVLYFHGNAGSLRGWKDVSHDIVPLGLDLFIIDYRGFGKSTGRLTEQGLYEDARASYAFLRTQGYEADDIVIYGRSIGSGVASELASTHPCRALILETPFTSLPDLASALAPHFFPRLTLRFRFENARKLAGIKVPVLLLHGDQDEIIPHSHSEALAALIGRRARLVLIEKGRHNDLSAHPAHSRALREFLNHD
jgi:uncharacterized protein